ncbi:MAG TPA: helix-turn-helix domain-containing protein [Micromonospora sp.]
MPRPRAYATDEIVRAARDLFWERGYEATSMADLEQRTGLNRSSIYQAFGSKRGLFDETLRHYLREVAEPRLTGLDRAGAGLPEIVDYLRALGDVLAGHPGLARNGCLMVNSVAELSTRDDGIRDIGLAYRERIAAALARALRTAGQGGQIPPTTVEARGRLLTATVIGVLLTARLSPAEAGRTAHAAADEVDGWRGPGLSEGGPVRPAGSR